MTVLHYKTNFLNPSETFIYRVIQNHHQFKPVGMCVHPRSYIEDLKVYKKPQRGISYFVNTLCFHLNWCLPFYIDTINRVRPDIIHAHFGFDGYRMMKAARRKDVPLVVSFYGSDVSRLPNEFDWKRRYKKLAKASDALVAATDHMKQRLINLGFPRSKIRIIPFGLDLEKFSYTEEQSRSRKIMMVGRMVEKKGFSIAIEALHYLHKDGWNYSLDLYGDGILWDDLKEQVDKLGLRNQVQFHGHVRIERVIEEHSQHELLLAPSLTANDGDEEGLPNTILEAMASGTVVITTNHAAIGEVIQNEYNGLIIEEGNAKALAEAIKFAYSPDCDLKKMNKKARKTIENQFEIHNVVDQIESLYQEVIANYD